MPGVTDGEPDAHGQAALLLVESLLHALVERRVLSASEVRISVEVAREVKRDIAEHAHESRERMEHSLELLAAIERSFAAYDGPANRAPSLPR